MPAYAQPTPADGASCRPTGMFAMPDYTSVEVLPDHRVTFRVCAPEAQDVRVTSSDIADIIPMGFPPGTPFGLEMTQDDTGLWSVTTAKPVPADTYRFNFMVDGARVPDPLGTMFSEERVGINSMFQVPGPEGAFQQWNKDVAHGVVSEITYWSDAIGAPRRAHIYTPPGYMDDDGEADYPVLYLVHGAGDSDDSWSTVGRENVILDNLIAAGKAKKMIVVMPDGHTPVRPDVDLLANNDFGNDLIQDLIPYVDSHFRTIDDPDARAMAGLSMGGAHTIRNGLTHPDLFHYIGIFSMGLGMQGAGDQVADYEKTNDAALKQAAQDLKLVYYAMGKDDFLHGTVAPTRGIFEKYGIDHIYNESEGGHTWINWRRYFADFAPRLFQ
ncbi:esterase [Altererythrobacter endophyticus]|uniref:Esterase n=2 Tax=Altericroceibacterium endophyticum TaxID=1808508 RepID=A0A6I4T4Z8_9SPHN|nr:esterase [Altericroceibacterium endophyticum]